jgi:predicted nuclease with TOPRIM domain
MEENFYKEVNDALKNVFAITSRIDERMKVLIENHNDSKEKIEKLCDQQITMLNRLTILENRNSMFSDIKSEINTLENKVGDMSERLLNVEKELTSTNNKWATVIDFVFKVGVVVIGAIILWKLGLNP